MVAARDYVGIAAILRSGASSRRWGTARRLKRKWCTVPDWATQLWPWTAQTRHPPEHPARFSRQHDGRPPREARSLRGVGLPRGLGRGSRAPYARPPGGPRTGARDPAPGGRALSHRAGEPRVPGVDGGGDPHRDERTGAVGGDQRGAHPGGPGARRPRGYPSRPHAVASRAAPRGAGRSAGQHPGRGRGRAPRLARNARARVSTRAARADRGDGRRSRRRPPADVGGTMLICIPPSGGGTHLGDLSDFPAPPQSGRALSARPAATRKTTGFLSEGYRVGSACALGFFVYAPFSVAKSLLLDRLPARAGGRVPSPTLRTFFKGCRMRRCFAQLS